MFPDEYSRIVRRISIVDFPVETSVDVSIPSYLPQNIDGSGFPLALNKVEGNPLERSPDLRGAPIAL